MISFDPDKTPTKRTFLRRVFSLNPAADVRRARLDYRDVRDSPARKQHKKQRSTAKDVKELRRKGILK